MKIISSKNLRNLGRLLRPIALTSGLLLSPPISSFAQVIPGQYIAVFKGDVGDPAAAAGDIANQHAVNVQFVYQHSIRGFAFNGSEQAAQALKGGAK